jgi:hypothetical protein
MLPTNLTPDRAHIRLDSNSLAFIADQERAAIPPQREVELRLHTQMKPISRRDKYGGISRKEYASIKQQLDRRVAETYSLASTQFSTIERYDLRRGITRRHITTADTDLYDTKTRYGVHDVFVADMYNVRDDRLTIRLAYSSEDRTTDKQQFDKDRPQQVERLTRVRHIYGFANYEIHLSATTSSYIEYSLECELNTVTPDLVVAASTFLLSLLFDTVLLSTVEERLAVNAALASFALADSRTLEKRDLLWGGVLSDTHTVYISYKADGARVLLYITTQAIWITDRSTRYNLVTYTSPGQGITTIHRIQRQYDGTVIEGEYLSIDKRNILYMYDCLLMKRDGDTFSSDRPYSQRLVSVVDVRGAFLNQLSAVNLFIKDNDRITDECSFFPTVNFYLGKKPAYPTDGIVFTPNESTYAQLVTAIRDERSKENPIVKPLPILKWKPLDKLTIDFKVYKSPSSYTLWTKEPPYAAEPYRRFVGNTAYPFDANTMLDATSITEAAKREGLDPDGAIVELAWLHTRFSFVRFREDKEYPNSTRVAISNWVAINNPVREADIRGRNLELQAAYHNRCKRYLYSLLPDNYTLLDIGTGLGGDISKWSKAKLVYAVEPDAKNIATLQSRLATSRIQAKVEVIQAGGEDTTALSRPLSNVKAISLMFSLNFFSPETMPRLLRNINSSTAQYLLFFAMDADCLMELFSPALYTTNNEPRIRETLALPGEGVVSLLPNGKIFLAVPTSSTLLAQEEYPIRVQLFLRELVKAGWKIDFVRRAEEERLLTDVAKLFSSFYVYGMLTRAAAIEKRALPSTQKGQIRQLPTHWTTVPLYSFYTLGGGDCFFHAVLSAIDPKYDSLPDTEKSKAAREFRLQVRDTLAKENPRYPGYTWWETIGRGSLFEAFIQQLLSDVGPSNKEVDYSYDGLYNLLTSTQGLGDEVYVLVADTANIDIYAFRPYTTDLEFHLAIREVEPRDRSVLVTGGLYHYESMKEKLDGGYVGLFAPTSRVIHDIEQLPGVIPVFKPYNPDIVFQAAIDKLLQDRLSDYFLTYLLTRFNEDDENARHELFIKKLASVIDTLYPIYGETYRPKLDMIAYCIALRYTGKSRLPRQSRLTEKTTGGRVIEHSPLYLATAPWRQPAYFLSTSNGYAAYLTLVSDAKVSGVLPQDYADMIVKSGLSLGMERKEVDALADTFLKSCTKCTDGTAFKAWCRTHPGGGAICDFMMTPHPRT